MKKEVVRRISQNGREGIVVVAEEGTTFPARGRLEALGRIEGKFSFEFFAAAASPWVVVGDDLEPVAGCATVISIDLQGGKTSTLLVGGDFICYRDYGYKRRSNRVVALVDGAQVELPATVLAAMGIIPVDRRPVEVEVPAIESGLAAALKAAGIR